METVFGLDAVFLSRLQFAFTIMFHYLFPPMTIGLGVLLVFMEGMYLRTRNPLYESMAKFWTSIFALNFAIGVASGIVMEFQFGTNWATYSRFVGDVFGSALAAEGIFAFFLESGFLAILVFGWDKVSPRVHFFSTVMVALGSMFSAVWIVVANSWQQTPAGHHIVQHELFTRAEIVDFWAVVFNPSSVIRLTHTLIGAFILGAFFVMSVTAFYILRGRHQEFARRCFSMALVVALVASLAQLAAGHVHAIQVYEYQPAKMAAYEAIFETTDYAPLYLMGIPDVEQKKVHLGLPVPGMLSFLIHFDPSAEVTGLDAFPEDERPPVQIPFQAYHIMISLGMLFIASTLGAGFLWWRGTLYTNRWVMRFFVIAVIFPYISNQAGWVAAEVGRQPWVVYGLLRTSESVSKSVDALSVLISLVGFGLIYLLLFIMFLYVLDRKIRKGPPEPRAHDEDGEKFKEALTSRGKSQHGLAESEEG